jgi:hypothetical protein
MKSATIHHLNSIIIVLSCIIAFFIPFELFLFSYGILGPLHYLTEIGWLHKKNYFTKGKYDFVFLILTCIVLVYWNYNPPKRSGLMVDVIFFSLVLSAVFVFIKDWLYRIFIIVFALVIIGFINNSSQYYTMVAVFLPTIIHVFIFTWLFMVFGVLKEKSWPGLISIVVLIICAIVLFNFQPTNLNYTVSEYCQNSYARFNELNYRLIKFFDMGQITKVTEIFTTNAGFVIMRFIAFAYTYHYLNWFSKTSVIKWHDVPKKTFAFIVIVWLIAAGLYIYDYNVGLEMLFFLSFLHVFLEFPLNVVSITGIGKEITAFVKKR